MKLKPSFNVSTSSLSLPTPVLPTLKPLLQLNLGDASPFSSSNLNSLLEESSSESGRYRTKAAQSTTRIRSEGYYEDTIARTELSNARAIRLIRESCLVILSRGNAVGIHVSTFEIVRIALMNRMRRIQDRAYWAYLNRIESRNRSVNSTASRPCSSRSTKAK